MLNSIIQLIHSDLLSFFTVGYNVTISAPHMHAHALEMLQDKLVPGARALDVGSGSGYLTACMARLVQPGGKVIGVEHIPQLVDISLKNISKNGCSLLDDQTLQIVLDDGRLGYPQGGPYDAIHVGAAAVTVHDALINQLRSPGRIFIPVQDPKGYNQYIWTIDKDVHGTVTRKKLCGVNYVPLTDAPVSR